MRNIVAGALLISAALSGGALAAVLTADKATPAGLVVLVTFWMLTSLAGFAAHVKTELDA